MKEDLLGNTVIHADETVILVLHEPNKKRKTIRGFSQILFAGTREY